MPGSSNIRLEKAVEGIGPISLEEMGSVKLLNRIDTKYLTILPTEYILKGDNTQSVDMLWYASVSTADGRIVDIDPSSLSVSYVNYLGNTVDIKGTVTKQVRNDSGTLVTATNANTDGKRDIVITSTAPNGNTAKGETIKITLSPNGIIKVESEALASRAIKDFQFKVYLKNATGVDPVTITIRHFPLASRVWSVAKVSLHDSRIGLPVSTPGIMCTLHRIAAKFVPSEAMMGIWALLRRV